MDDVAAGGRGSGEAVWVTDSEMGVIGDVPSKATRKVAFTMLCLAKREMLRRPKANGWVNEDVKTIFRLARVDDGSMERYQRLGTMYDMGLIEIPRNPERLRYRVAFIDDSGERAMCVFDFRELGYQYLKYSGENFVRCERCGVLTRGNRSGTRKYCPECAGYEPQVVKTVRCVRCGSDFVVMAKNNRTRVCPYCRANARDCG